MSVIKPCVGGDAEDPAVEAENEVVERPRIAAGEEQRQPGEQHEQSDQAAAGGVEPAVAVTRHGRPGAAGEDRDDHVLRNREQPPLDQDEAAREPLRIVDLEPRRVRRIGREREGRVLVGAEGAVGVEADAPRPAEHADVVVEDPAGIAPGEQDREARDDGREDEADPEEEENDEVRDGEQPLDEPLPAAHVGVELAGEAKGKGLAASHGVVLLRLGDWWATHGPPQTEAASSAILELHLLTNPLRA